MVTSLFNRTSNANRNDSQANEVGYIFNLSCVEVRNKAERNALVEDITQERNEELILEPAEDLVEDLAED
ncbi:hypothetical protein A0J61_11182 [Choanephora cucurbitarum]|uniref:Uncharacterized protein n=1 Tax=Choanephora cucurbitarum TaxID=101091 RepID=A0A1C7MWG6_9FUNG|nr:hypothetical protein A0J61_11182 [Choanephora cucurbitarum]